MSPVTTVGLVELPEQGLFDSQNRNRASVRRGSALISKQVLLSNLQGDGFDTQLINMKDGDYEQEYGKVSWGGESLSKVYIGRNIHELEADAVDVWGITNNFSQHRELACMTISHLTKSGRPVVLGGSDVIAEPIPYLQAGATALVLDKSGAANKPILDYVTGKSNGDDLSNVILADGKLVTKWRNPLSPQDWPLPEQQVVEQCLGTEYWSAEFPEQLLPIGSIFSDIGCDRKCDFCQTPNYRLGYKRMDPERTLQWLAAQKEAGAKSVIGSSDQFLGRVLWKEGREEVLEIMQGLREMGLTMLWPNGLEIRKATVGRGFNRQNTDLTPDEELINAVWGWDGKVGTYHAYIPAERPISGRENYSKLLPWQEHRALLRAIVRSGLPALSYGIIIGFEDETHQSLLRLEEAIQELHQELVAINPSLNFQVSSFAISPIPGTIQGKNLRKTGLLRYDDPVLYGGLWTPSVDTYALSYREIAEWQIRLLQIGSVEGQSHFINTNFSPAPTGVTKDHQPETIRIW